MSAVLKKGAPSRSYPSRQRKLGPAPFASFEDLSDELESPGVGGDDNKVNVMPEIKEDRHNERSGAACQSPTQMTPGGEEDTPVAVRAHKNVTATSSTSTVTFAPSYSAPTSGPTSGLQTPSTPRIDISCASSSTPPSDESASEKELFQGGLGLAFHEEAVDDLRSSTEELDLGEEEISSEEERRRKRLEEQELREQDIYRRSSHPANIFSRKASAPAAPPPPQEEDNFQRKPSAHSLFLEGLLNRPCRHASFGHGDYIQRPGAVSSLSTHSAGSGYRSRSRSPSPHKLMFETSFCGSKPIPTKSMDQSSPPKESTSSSAAATAAIGEAAAAVANKSSPSASSSTSKPTGIQSYSQPQSALGSAAATPTTSNRFDDRALKSPKKMVVTPGWERHQAELEQVCREVTSASSAAGPKDIDSISRSKTPLSPQPSSLGFDSRRPSTGRRSVSPHKMLLETSFCGSKPIPTRSMEMESPPKDLPDLGALLAECNKLAAASNQSSTSQVNEHCHKTVTTAQVHRHSSSGDRSSVISKEEDQPQPLSKAPVSRKSDAGQYTLERTSATTAAASEWNSVPYLPGSPDSPKSSDLWQPISPSPRLELRSPAFTTTASPLSPSPLQPSPREDACSISSSSSPQGLRGQDVSPPGRSPDNSYIQATSPSPAAIRSSLTTKYNEDNKCSKEIDHSATPSTTKKMFSQQQGGSSSGGGGGKSVGFQSEKSESSRDHDDDDGEITTEMQISEDPTVTVEDVPIESKGLFFQSDSFDEEGDLPYVPTTLPQEKSTGVAILPVSERKKMALMLNTMPVQRPKVNRPAAPASLNDYIEYSKNTLPKKGKGAGESGGSDTGKDDGSEDVSQVVAKMKINLPREDSLNNSSGGKGKGHRKSVPTTTWTDFAHMGLLSPREIRRKMKEENGAVDDISSYHSDSSSTNDIPGAVDGAEEEAESLLKLPKVPFAMDLDVHSNRSSVISQDEVQKSPSECSALLGSPDEPDLGSKKSDSRE